jgi:hypothetical protein
LIKE